MICSFNFLNNGALASWMQVLIYLATLILLFIQLKHLRRQTQTQIETLKTQLDNEKYSDYIRCQSDFTRTMRQLLNGNLHEMIYNSLYKKGKSKFNSDWTKYDEEDKKVYAFFEIIYELIERVFCIKESNDGKKVIDADEWDYWQAWLDDVVGHPIFNDVHFDSLGMYDQRFEELIKNKLIAANNYKNNIEK